MEKVFVGSKKESIFSGIFHDDIVHGTFDIILDMRELDKSSREPPWWFKFQIKRRIMFYLFCFYVQ